MFLLSYLVVLWKQLTLLVDKLFIVDSPLVIGTCSSLIILIYKEIDFCLKTVIRLVVKQLFGTNENDFKWIIHDYQDFSVGWQMRDGWVESIRAWSAVVYRWWGYIYWDCFIVNTVFIVVYLTCHDFLRSQKGKYLITNLWGRLKCSVNVPQVLLIIWLPDFSTYFHFWRVFYFLNYLIAFYKHKWLH